jgi:hypothetical protein
MWNFKFFLFFFKIDVISILKIEVQVLKYTNKYSKIETQFVEVRDHFIFVSS